MPCSSAPGGTALKAAADRMSRAPLARGANIRDLRTSGRERTATVWWRYQFLENITTFSTNS